MDDDAALTRVVRINVIAGSVLVALLVLTAVLVLLGALPWDIGLATRVGIFGIVPATLAFVTAWAAHRDVIDPSGRERRYQQGAVAVAAGVIVLGIVAVAGTVVWGLVR